MAERLVQESGFYSLKLPRTLAECQQNFQLGKLHAGQFLAAIELGRRLFQQREVLRNVEQVAEYLRDMKKLKKEVFVAFTSPAV